MLWDFFVTNKYLIPTLSLVFAILLHPFFYNKEGAIDAKLESGTLPTVSLTNAVQVNRSDIVQLLRESFIQHTKTNLFGVVLGPSGTGKTYLTRLLHPTAGVLYYEISDPSFFPERLARSIGMTLVDDSHIFDIIREKTGINSWISFYRLPQNLSLAMSFVLETLAERGAIFQKNYNRMPCLFIDGVDLLAKKHPEVFVTLVDLAKHYANNAMLRIVLVGRESHIVPLLDSTPSQIWQADIIEIVDIDRENTLHYLTQNGLTATVAESVFNLTGGRFAHLNKVIEIYEKKKALNEEDVFEYIRSHLVVQCYGKKVYKYDRAEEVLNYVLQYGPDVWPELFGVFNDTALMNAFNGLIELNLLRYTAKGTVTWHNEVVRNTLIDHNDIYKDLNLDEYLQYIEEPDIL